MLALEALLAKIGLFEGADKEFEADLSGFIFEKLSPEEPLLISPLTKRQKEQEIKQGKENEYSSMLLRDKIAYLHKAVFDPQGQKIAKIQYSEDPDTGKLVREGEVTNTCPDPFGIESGISMFKEYYDSALKK